MKGKKLRATLAYPALFEPELDGGFTVTFPEAGIAATYGANWDAACTQAEDMLEEAILGMMAHGEDVPWPASVPKGRLRPSIHLPAPTAAKLEVYRAMRAEGLGAEQLAQRLGWQPAQVKRLFGRAARLDHIEAALRALGRRLVVTSEAA
jgi:antitoxin HicB